MQIIECPRDAMQGLSAFIPTEDKVRYINQLLRVGFDTLDFGSFVSPKAIPQMRDTAEVLQRLDLKGSRSKLLAIVANVRGAEDAAAYPAIRYLGFPLSISETFQQRNTNKSIAEAMNTLREIRAITQATGKQLVTYISMGFGNPYGDAYSPALVTTFVDELMAMGSEVISLADTVGVATPAQITELFTSLSRAFPGAALGVHLHATPQQTRDKIQAAYDAGCQRFDGAIRGFGGCPMAKDDLVGNMATEQIVAFLEQQGADTGLDKLAFAEALRLADEIFPKH